MLGFVFSIVNESADGLILGVLGISSFQFRCTWPGLSCFLNVTYVLDWSFSCTFS